MADRSTTTNNFLIINKSIALISILFQSFFLSPAIIFPSTKFKYPQILLSYVIFFLWLSNTLTIFWQFFNYQILFFKNASSIIVIALISFAHTISMVESWTYRNEYENLFEKITEFDDTTI